MYLRTHPWGFICLVRRDIFRLGKRLESRRRHATKFQAESAGRRDDVGHRAYSREFRLATIAADLIPSPLVSVLTRVAAGSEWD